MGLFNDDIQKTSISLYIERLSNLDEIDWYLLEQLSECIQMQENGPREAIETIRKKLKHGDTQQKLRVLEVLKLLMENSNQQFRRQFIANEKMKERFELILVSPGENAAVKKELVSLLGAWLIKYKNEASMKSLRDLYEMGIGRRHSRPRANTDTVNHQRPSIQPPSHRQTDTSPSPPSTINDNRRALLPVSGPSETVEKPKNTKPRSHSSAPRINHSSSTTPTRVFNFEKAKSKILEEIAVANSNSNNLINALKLINTNEDRWEIELQHDKRLQEYHEKCEESRRIIVRYARLVEDEEWIGTLLSTNEELLKALDMYDIMLTGEIPAVWLNQQQQQSLFYCEPLKAIRAPPPPPPPTTLQIETSFSNMQLTKRKEKEEEEEERDPFADPDTPIDEDENRR
ncbi:uncharacterized protein BX663DRAFT_512672 [Cokeromyces recurvatus]|uniref:uncharacterized protein n=1 Tax=Cokeromyces recurvatus TaxID=90255 RepID=UPI00221F1CA5|nr:uncharacterized protein BX663DRAFT_512672 [Cokeromyces recurvatus]KAI7901868.1 hypothetical protein BX663DRAFT_512672 [Cokeromyces recurvatus]